MNAFSNDKKSNVKEEEIKLKERWHVFHAPAGRGDREVRQSR